jgi:antitoxin VapB
MNIGKVFQVGRSQAIRLPKEFRVDTDEVILRRTAEGFAVITKNPWDIFFEGVALLSGGFMSSGRKQPRLKRRR